MDLTSAVAEREAREASSAETSSADIETNLRLDETPGVLEEGKIYYFCR